jgi:hypothetical protein
MGEQGGLKSMAEIYKNPKSVLDTIKQHSPRFQEILRMGSLTLGAFRSAECRES